MSAELDTRTLFAELQSGSRAALSRAITLVESANPRHAASAIELLNRALEASAMRSVPSVRLGLSGVPGAGKSTFVDALGNALLQRKVRVAVLAVDPSSARTKGSILGDKTRMQRIANHPDVFVRPQPSGGALGGVAPSTREAVMLCEAAGYDWVIVETVGVGQSEAAVAKMVDTFALISLPGSGDELQGIKRGVLELVDIVIVNKCDGASEQAGSRAALELKSALHMFPPLHPFWPTPVLKASALENRGIEEFVERVLAHRQAMNDHHIFDAVREEQQAFAFDTELQRALWASVSSDPSMNALRIELADKVAKGAIPARTAVQTFFAASNRARP